ncbi:hypothetical protein [Oceanicoccus sagamiensis]|nr:hypothetical protein [Oceanicoccus sagamiensis]
MDTTGFVFGMIGFTFGLLAFLKIGALEKKLKETGVLDKDFDSEKEI